MINNNVYLIGRLTKDLELRKTPSGLSHTRFTIACDRRFRSQDTNTPTADFIGCVAWRQSAEYLCSYAKKGDLIAVSGHLTTGSYDGQNGKVYTTDVTCEEVKILSSKKVGQVTEVKQEAQYQQTTLNNGYDACGYNSSPNVEINSDDLPFY